MTELTDEERRILKDDILEALNENYVLKPEGETDQDCMAHDIMVSVENLLKFYIKPRILDGYKSPEEVEEMVKKERAKLLNEIDGRKLIDQCWAILNKHYEIFYERNAAIKRPQFRFVLSHDELMALRKYAANLEIAARVYEIKNGQQEILFGHPIIEQKRTPYVEPDLQALRGE